jgi:hypothetical protein
MGQDYRFEERQRVRLRSDIDTSIYGDWACIGNEGWVIKRRKDKFDLPEILVQWDKTHWAYNGVGDGWAMEEHFEAVEEMNDKPDKQQQLDSLLNSFGQGLKAILGESEPESSKKPSGGLKNLLEADAEADDQEFDEAVKHALEHIQDAEGFVVIGVARRDHPKSESGMLIPFALSFSKTMESELLLGAHMASVAARAHQDITVQAIQAIAMGDE